MAVTVYAVVAGLLVAAGLIGTVLTVLPGLVLVVAGIAVWAVPRNDVVGWTVLAAAFGIALIGSVVGYALVAVVPVVFWSRIALGRHRVHELLVGLVLGVLTGIVLVRL